MAAEHMGTFVSARRHGAPPLAQTLLIQSIISLTVGGDVVQPVGELDSALSILSGRQESVHGWFHAVVQPPPL